MEKKKLPTKEDKWTNSICDILRSANLGDNIYVDILTKIPYALELFCFDENWNIDTKGISKTSFTTDMIIYEKENNKIIPRVIVESKITSVSTHDAITYSQKAMYHKNVIPFLRYGIMLGNRKDYAIPGRLFRHGTNFDFLFSFKDYTPNTQETETFISMIKKEIEYSRQTEYVLNNTRSHDRTKYYMLQKEFNLKEVDNTKDCSEC